jgi:hypothetical protein
LRRRLHSIASNSGLGLTASPYVVYLYLAGGWGLPTNKTTLRAMRWPPLAGPAVPPTSVERPDIRGKPERESFCAFDLIYHAYDFGFEDLPEAA